MNVRTLLHWLLRVADAQIVTFRGYRVTVSYLAGAVAGLALIELIARVAWFWLFRGTDYKTCVNHAYRGSTACTTYLTAHLGAFHPAGWTPCVASYGVGLAVVVGGIGCVFALFRKI